MPQINVNREIAINETLDFINNINNTIILKEKLTLKDFIIKAAHLSTLSFPSFRHYCLNNKFYFLEDFTILYKSFSGEQKIIEIRDKMSINYYRKSNEGFYGKSFFLIEDVGDFDIKTVKPILNVENVF
jgi:hypothetical protein